MIFNDNDWEYNNPLKKDDDAILERWIAMQCARTKQWPNENMIVEQMAKTAYSIDSDAGMPILNPMAYKMNISRHNAHDYVMATMFAKEKNRILDFGAGFGRQACLFQKAFNKHYLAIEGVAASYHAQQLYFRKLKTLIQDATVQDFDFDNFKPGIHHLPAKDISQVKDESYDLALAVQVFPEMTYNSFEYCSEHLVRVLKKGGLIYQRDHHPFWPDKTPPIVGSLEDLGMEIVALINGYDRKDFIHGIIRIWRKR